MPLQTARTGSEGGIRLTQSWAIGPYLTTASEPNDMSSLDRLFHQYCQLVCSFLGIVPRQKNSHLPKADPEPVHRKVHLVAQSMGRAWCTIFQVMGIPYSQHHFVSCKLIRAVTPLAGLPILLPKNAAALRIRRGADKEA